MTAVLLVVVVTGPPTAAQAAAPAVATAAQGLRADGILRDGSTARTAWHTGQPVREDAARAADGTAGLHAGAVTATAGPATGGGSAAAEVRDLVLAPATVTAGTLSTSCTLTATAVTGGTEASGLRIDGRDLHPGVNTAVDVPGAATGVAGRQTATYSTRTGRLSWTIRGLDLTLPGGGMVVAAESTCAGTVRFAPIRTAGQPIVPGGAATPTVTVVNDGDVAAPDTVVTIPLPPAGYLLGPVTTGGGGSCTPGSAFIRCAGLTVPGGGRVTVALPVSLAAGATGAGNWAPADITAISTPIAALTGTTLDVTGGGTLTTVADPAGGSITVAPVTVSAGHSAATTVTVGNRRPAAATGTVTIPLAGRPAGVTAVDANVRGVPCTVGDTAITCPGVTVPGDGTAAVRLTVTAAGTAEPGATWDLAGITGILDGTAVSGAGRLVTVGDAGPAVTAHATGPARDTVRPGERTAVTVRLRNDGAVAAPGTVVVVTAPAGTTFGAVAPPAGTRCATPSPGTVRCTTDLDPGAGRTLTLPLDVSPQADPGTPLTGGCVGLGDDAGCAQELPAIRLRTPLDRRLTVQPRSGTVEPGGTGTARIELTSARDETGLTVAVPVTALPAGFRVTAAAGPGGPCDVGPAAVTCTGLTLRAGDTSRLTLRLALASRVLPPARWTASGISVSDGAERLAVDGVLAVAGNPRSTVTATTRGPADGTVAPGGAATVTVVARNRGPADAVASSFVVVAPGSNTFGPLGGAAADVCVPSSGSRVVCTVDLAAGAGTPALDFPLTVAATADPFRAVDGGCVELDGTAGCGPGDEPIDAIVPRVPFDRRVAVGTTTAAVTPGRDARATVAVTAQHGTLHGLRVTVPLDALPAGLRVATATAGPAAACTIGGTDVTCTGVAAADGGTAVVRLGIAAAPATGAGAVWTATGVTVARGADTVTTRGRLAMVTAPRVTLAAGFTAPRAAIPPGGTGRLGVRIDNLGPSDAAAGRRVGVLAPVGATFGGLTGVADRLCDPVTPARLSCLVEAAAAPPAVFGVPLAVSPAADPAIALTGGCADLDDDGVCRRGDPPLPRITPAVPLDRLLDIGTGPVTVRPGTTGTATVRLSAAPAQHGLTLRIPIDGRPAQLDVAPAGTGSCTLPDSTAIVCTGVDVPAGGSTVEVAVRAPADAPADLVWAGAAITATDAEGDVATGAGLVVRTGAAGSRLTAVVTGPAPLTVPPGGTAVLTASIDNPGPAAATDALVTVQAPVGTAFQSLTGAAAAACQAGSATRLNCRVTLAPGGPTAGWLLPVSVPDNRDPAQHVVGGCLDLGGDGSCGGPEDVTFPDIVLRVPLAADATVGAGAVPVRPGITAEATITVALGAAHGGVSVVVPRTGLPAGLTLTGLRAGAAACTPSPTAFTCGPADVAGGGAVTLTATLTAAPSAPPGGVWAPDVTVTAGAEAVDRSVTAAIVAGPDTRLTVAVTGPAPGTVLPGGAGELRVTVHNAGPSDAVAARYVFAAPDGTTFAAPAGPAAGFCDRTSATEVVCRTDVGAGADLVFDLSVFVAADAEPGATVGGGCAGTGDDPCRTPLPAIELGTPMAGEVGIATTAVSTVPGLPGTGHVTVAAARDLSGLTVTVPLDTLPAGFTVTGFAGPAGATCALRATEVRCTGVDVRHGTGDAVALTVRTASGLPAGVSWTADAIAVTGAGGTVFGGGTLLTTGDPRTDVRARVSGPAGAVGPGGSTAMTVTVTNGGPSDATDRTAVVTAPAGTTFGPLSGRAAADCTATGGAELACVVSLVAGAAPVVWTLPLTVSAATGPGRQPGCVTLGRVRDCGAAAPHRSLAGTTTVTFRPVAVAPGGTGRAAVVLSGTSDRTGLTLTVPLGAVPAGLTVTGPAGCTAAVTELTCTGLRIDAGHPTTVTLRVQAGAQVAGDVTWTAAGVTLGADGQPRDRLTSIGVLAVGSTPRPAVTVTLGEPTVSPAAPGQRTVLPVTLSTPGPALADPYALVLLLPDGLTAGLPLPAGCLSGTGSVRCSVPVPAGAGATIALPLVVGADVPAGSRITGGCLVTTPGGPDYCAGSGDLPLPGIGVVAATTDLDLARSGGTPLAVPGGAVWAALTYRNTGPQSATGVTFRIDPPAGVTLAYAGVQLDAGGPPPARLDRDDLVGLGCRPDPGGDDNTAVCTGPEAAAGVTGRLWLDLAVDPDAPPGTRTVPVTVTTTSPEGDAADNTAGLLLVIGPQPRATGAGVVTGGFGVPAGTVTVTRAQAPVAGIAAPPVGGAIAAAGGVPAATATTAVPIVTTTVTAPATSPATGPAGAPGDATEAAPARVADQGLSGILVLTVMVVAAGVALRLVARARPKRRRPAR